MKHEECSCGATRKENTMIPKIEMDSPKTGDDTDMMLLFMMFCVSVFGAIGLHTYKIKHLCKIKK